MSQPAVVPAFLSRREAARRAGFSLITLIRAEKAGLFPHARRIGARRVGYLVDEVEEWVRTRRVVA